VEFFFVGEMITNIEVKKASMKIKNEKFNRNVWEPAKE